ncbi:crossover junction endonuclease MUS81-like isoform X2 [Orbicella faveolata]|uniref:crossover junction endonuclease MUS81-like isoform X2 n=2 Tax=Orbicella faveolata TaxID=48498 RepID=UPI0009E62E66|nr:crossover junction endonuclease MUS81-like isoform X2 [Orbicella faveolata]
MLTLYQQSQRINYRGYMTRAELQKEAQPLCDVSFTMPDPGSHYTAWSSMSTLTRKGFIIKTNNPARYSITDEGRKLAEKLETVTGDSLSPGSTGTAAPIPSGSVKSPSHASIDLTSDRNLDSNYLSAADVSRDFKPCFEKVSSSHDRFTRITEREKECKPARILEDDLSFTPDFVLRPGMSL